MKAVQLLYIRNVISRKRRTPQQGLSFFILVENIAYDKEIEVFWAGEDGRWQTLGARFHSPFGQNQELWEAEARFRLSSQTSLPGNIQCAVRYHVSGKEYWDNNGGDNYSVDADSGVRLVKDIPILNIGFSPTLSEGQAYYPITVAVHRSLDARKVHIHWSTDKWETSQQAPCFFKRNHWDKTARSNARNPNGYGYEIWTGGLVVRDAYRTEYAVCCDTVKEKIWDNAFGRNYTARRKPFRILTLNLHCYQEEDQDYKFSQIAKAIDELNIDIVCLQEVGEHWNGGEGNWNSNAAKIIRDRLKKPYHLLTDWGHIGFDRYREGVAILSKHELLAEDSGYVSHSQDEHNIHSRKVVMGQVHVPYMGSINVFSAHLSWWDDGFLEQFENLREWANQKHSDDVVATFLGGDFNIKAGSQGYVSVVNSKEYHDQFLKATSRKLFDRVYGNQADHWQRDLADDHRIDYIFMKDGSHLNVTSASVLFSDDNYGRVSDHHGYFAVFEPE